MVFRLFVPPGEGQHFISPKRPDPLGANATPQYVVFGSMAAAAGYAALVRRAGPRLGAPPGLSLPALFVKTAGRAGVYAAALASAAHCFYHYDFTSQVYEVSKPTFTPTPFRLYEKTDRYTVDDAWLAGAGAGMLAGLCLYRMRLSWWRRAMGMANVGAFTGLSAAHAYFHYTGERQTAAAELKELRKKRYLQFHLIYWDKLLMSGFSPPTQAYVTCTGVFHAMLLPQESYEFAGKLAVSQGATTETSQTPVAATPSYYRDPIDPRENLKQISVELTLSKLEEMETEKQSLLNEAEYVLVLLTKQEYEFCHTEYPDQDERNRKLREIQLLATTFTKLWSEADELTRTMCLWRNDLKQKAAWESANASDDTMEAWIPALSRCNPESHVPTLTIKKFTDYQEQLTKNIKDFEQILSNPLYADEAKKQARVDLEDARSLLKAADFLQYELEQKVKAHAARSGEMGVKPVAVESTTGKEEVGVQQTKLDAKVPTEVEKKKAKVEKTEVGGETGADETGGSRDGREPSSP